MIIIRQISFSLCLLASACELGFMQNILNHPSTQSTGYPGPMTLNPTWILLEKPEDVVV